MNKKLQLKGINYDTGVAYFPGTSSRKIWRPDDVERNLEVIADRLHCNAVNIYGSDLAKIVTTAEIAQRRGMIVSVQLRSIDLNRAGVLAAVASAADAAQALSRRAPVILNVGCEFSLFARGFLPGRTFLTRMRSMFFMWPFLSWINAQLSRFLRTLAAEARSHFDGQLTYSAGVWERVDWSPFDLIGVNLYRSAENEKTYESDLRRYLAIGKPVVITEFGCCTFRGADKQGGGGWLAIDHSTEPPEMKPGYVRDEPAQARLLRELIDLFVAEGVMGAFVFDFMESGNFRSDDPRFDLDMASYGIVAVSTPAADLNRIDWTPKAPFEAVARRYELL